MVLTINIKAIWLIGFILTVIGFKATLPILRKIKCGQFIRLEGPKATKAKRHSNHGRNCNDRHGTVALVLYDGKES